LRRATFVGSDDYVGVENHQPPPPGEAVDPLLQALAWSIEEGKQVPGVLSTEDLVRLEQVLRGGAPFPAGHYPKLRLFAQILARLKVPGAPTCTLGDALEAIASRASSLPPWPFVPTVEALSFRELNYAVNAAGIDREFRTNREGWIAHGKRSRRFISQALERVHGGGTVWVLGAGRAYDLPLDELAGHFRKVVLVDIDRAAMEETLLTIDEARRARFELVAADLTGIAAAWRSRTLEAIGEARDARAAAERMHELFLGYVVSEEQPWRFLGDAPELIVSQMILSQLNEPLERFARRAFEERFGLPLLAQHPGLELANMLFAHRVQQDHVRFLRRHAPAAVLTSDVAEQYTRLAATGEAELVGDELLLLGAYHLTERIPRGLAVVGQEEWPWHRALPRPAGVGSRMRVGAVLLRGE
jgi:hypothetical protein